MSISTELISDVATAVLRNQSQEDPVETTQMLAIVAQVHNTLRDLTNEERKERRRSLHRGPNKRRHKGARGN